MKKQLLHFSSLIGVLFSLSICASAQIVGTNCFVQGKYLDIGMDPNGSFGACNAQGAIPASYHRHQLAGAPPTGTSLAETYDYGHDGWGTGGPVFMGDYTYPGSPFEGWEIQVGGVRAQAFQNCAGTMGAGLTGSHTSYSNVASRATGTWTGTYTGGGGNISIRQETRVDTLASAVVVTTVLRNTLGTATAPVYYLRSCDPDNDQTWPGGGFFTNNTIVHQNQDAQHRVLVSSVGTTGASSYMGLGTRDCRARCFIYNSWPLGAGIDLSTPWNGTMAGGTYALGATANGDIGIGLVYNIGSIPGGDSAIISYAYIFNGNTGIDSAFPNPQIVINGTPKVSWPSPQPNYDTFDACLYPGLLSIPVNILYGTDKNWSWSKWTWSPGLGLATTTGVNNTITFAGLPPIITYTIIGTDSASGMNSCNKKIFYLTIKTCNNAEANSPCEGDTLWVNSPGDSTGATYQWYGPAPYAATPFGTTQRTFRYPAVGAMSGLYMCIKTVMGIPDTFFTTVTIHHKPVVSATSNAPMCIGAANTLSLVATCDSPGVTYTWSKTPPAFSSSSPNPVIPGFAMSDTGLYRVIVSSYFGCKDTATTNVTLVPLPPKCTVTAVTPYCLGDAFVPFVVSGLVTGTPGGVALWYSSMTGGTGTTTPPTVNTSIAGTYKFYFSQIVGSCESARDSVTVVVNPLPAPITGLTGVCQYFSITLSDPTVGGTWTSSNPSVASIGSSTGVVTGHLPGTATISYTLPTSCRTTTIVTVHPKPLPPVVPEVRPCQYKPVNALSVTVTGPGYSTTWYGLGVTPPMPFTSGSSSIVPQTDTTPGMYYYYVTQTSPFGCVSDSATYPVRIVPEPAPPTPHDTGYCQHDPNVAPIRAIGDSLRWYTSATGIPGSGSFTAPVPSVTNPGVVTYYVTQEQIGCESQKAPLKVTVYVLPDFKIVAEKDWVCQFDSLQLNYMGPDYVNPGYTWYLPVGSAFVNHTGFDQKNVWVRFDTTWGRHDVILEVSNYNGRCSTRDTMPIKVVPAPDAHAYIKPDVCLGDTITLALNDHTPNSHTYTWLIDGAPMLSSSKIDVISANNNTGGPYVISWHDSGLHVINVTGVTEEGCRALPTADTVKVHTLPDSRYTVSHVPNKFCVEDSVLFTAVVKDYAYNYKWEPEHSFSNQNKPEIWGRVELSRSRIMLTVTDPFGCKSTYSKQINPDECCTVTMPNAFTPNGDGKNDRYRPIFDGYRRFHVFRVTNRWGQTVFESANSEPSWDGTYNGVMQDLGTYFYYLRYDCGGKALETKGDVMLIR